MAFINSMTRYLPSNLPQAIALVVGWQALASIIYAIRWYYVVTFAASGELSLWRWRWFWSDYLYYWGGWPQFGVESNAVALLVILPLWLLYLAMDSPKRASGEE